MGEPETCSCTYLASQITTIVSNCCQFEGCSGDMKFASEDGHPGVCCICADDCAEGD